MAAPAANPTELTLPVSPHFFSLQDNETEWWGVDVMKCARGGRVSGMLCEPSGGVCTKGRG